MPFARIGRVSISSCGSIPAVGVPVTLRILSAPEPREQRPSPGPPRSRRRVAGFDFADLDMARVVTCA